MSAHSWDDWAERAAKTQAERQSLEEARRDYRRPFGGAPEPQPFDKCGEDVLMAEDLFGLVWVHPDGCTTKAQGHAMYAVCEHGHRALFLGRPGDRYVTTGADR